MVDRLGTLVGFVIGVSLILFGITWPDHQSNYFVYTMKQFEQREEVLKARNAPRAELEALQKELKEFQDSFLAGVARFLDLKSFLIVIGGSYAATLIAFPFRRAIATVVYLAMVFARERRDEEFFIVYNAMLEFAEMRFRNEMIPDEKVAAIPIYFMRDAIENFIQVDWVTEEMVGEIIDSEIEAFDYEQNQEIRVMEYMGRVAPAFGMLGTVVGLILLLGRAAGPDSDIIAIMGGMSVALITTLYGVLTSQLAFLPVGAKLARNKESYVRLYEMIREGTIYLHRRERPDVIEQDLAIYLSKKRRMKLREEKQAALARGDLGL
ncbi:MAG: MotA/TolQ/ExbB proton channel family protein [Deltaproteobacteria bacterium]|nr:MotA/TolQ/ExbB proton channel family protein [Deltaproteobacteria bacterium]